MISQETIQGLVEALDTLSDATNEIVYGEIPPVSTLAIIWTMMLAAFGTSWFVQPISYYGGLGAAGSYISWVSGSAAGCA